MKVSLRLTFVVFFAQKHHVRYETNPTEHSNLLFALKSDIFNLKKQSKHLQINAYRLSFMLYLSSWVLKTTENTNHTYGIDVFSITAK